MERKGAIPLPVATKMAGLDEGRYVKYPWGPVNGNMVPFWAEASMGENNPLSTLNTQRARVESVGVEIKE